MVPQFRQNLPAKGCVFRFLHGELTAEVMAVHVAEKMPGNSGGRIHFCVFPGPPADDVRQRGRTFA